MRRAFLASTMLAGLALATLVPAAQAQVGIALSIAVAPPELPIYEQPPMPGPGYIWTPGYWAYATDGYYWVPATWVEPPSQDLLWTPGYWSFEPRGYVWNAGYWGVEVGYYGGIDYGYGYAGSGYSGGYWQNHAYYYNRDYNNFGSVHVTHEYTRAGDNDTRAEHRTSFNGGSGGVLVQPTAQQAAYAQQSHTAPAAVQLQHQQAAAGNRALFLSANHGQPPVAATSRANQFSGAGVVQARPAAAPAPIRPEAQPHGPTQVQHEPTAPVARPPNEPAQGPRPGEPPAHQAVPELRANEPPPHAAAQPPRPAEPAQRQAEPAPHVAPGGQRPAEREDKK